MWIHKFIVSRYLKYSEKSRDMEIQKMEAWYPNYRVIFKAAINQLSYIMRINRIPFITGITIEVTNSCNLKCKVCPTTTMKRKKGLMDFGLFKKIIDENR